MPTCFDAFDARARGDRESFSRQHGLNENVAVVDYLDHVRCFGRFLHAFAGLAP